MFEDRVHQQTIVACKNCAFGNAREQERSFYYLWKQYLAKSGGTKEGAAAEKERLDMFKGMMGSDDDDDGPAGGGAAAAPPAAEGPAAAPEPEASQVDKD